MVSLPPARSSAAMLVVCLAMLASAACGREARYVRNHVAAMHGVEGVETVPCGKAEQFPSAGVCATVAMSDGAVLRFTGLGFGSFGPVPSRVRVAEAGGRSPLIVSCEARAVVADLDRSGLFGHHFSPALDGLTDAIRRHRDVIEELEFWPQCPQFWELEEKGGPRYRYCAHAARTAAEPPPAFCDQSFESAK